MLALPNIPDAAQTSGESAFAVHDAFKQGGTGLGGNNAGLPTLKQGNAELSLKRPNRRRKARSSDVKALGRSADTARLADHTKIRQLVEVHVSPPFPVFPTHYRADFTHVPFLGHTAALPKKRGTQSFICQVKPDRCRWIPVLPCAPARHYACHEAGRVDAVRSSSRAPKGRGSRRQGRHKPCRTSHCHAGNS